MFTGAKHAGMEQFVHLALSNFMLAEISSHTPRVFITGQIL
jgi:hypothetical protein